MRTTGLILLIVLISFLNIPVQINVPFDAEDNTSSLITLDVCNQHGAAVSLDSDTPGILEYQHGLAPLATPTYHDQINYAFNPFLFTSQDERPPEA